MSESSLRPFRFTVTNNTTQAANDLHVVISGSGGQLHHPVLVHDAPGCGTTPGQPSTDGNRVDVVWPAACVDPGARVTIEVQSPFSHLAVERVTWTRDGTALPPKETAYGNDDEGNGGGHPGGQGRGPAVVPEAGDAGGTCAQAQALRGQPVIVQGEIRRANDVDCYTFPATAGTTYTIGVTGNRRRATAQGPGNQGPQASLDGVLVYTPNRNGRVCVCVSGGNPGAYVLTIFG